MEIRHEHIKSKFSIRCMSHLSSSVPHWHQRMELLLINSGSFAVTIQGKTYRANPGDLLFIRTGQIHHIQPDDDSCSTYVSTFAPTLIYTLRPDLACPCTYISRAQLEEAGIFREISSLFAQMLEEKIQAQEVFDILVQARILQIYGLLSRYFEATPGLDEKSPDKFLDFRAVLSYISENFRQPITLADIAQQLNYSTSYVSSMFASYAGVNYKVYLDSIRISEASWLLQSTSQSVSQISASCGFENIRTFNNVFRRVTGSTPTQFRKRS